MAKYKPEVSCIIIALNEEKHIKLLLDSLKKQTYKNFEIIVADFNSKDNTRKIAKKYGCAIVPGGKQSFARNSGAKIARGKYLLFLDADSILEEDFIKINLNSFKLSRAGVASVPLRPLNGSVLDHFFFRIYNGWMRLIKYISPHGTGACILVKKNVFERVGGFDESILVAEDMDFLKRAAKYKFTILPFPISTSVRRFQERGRLTTALTLLLIGFHRFFYREVKKDIFDYNRKRLT